MKQPYNTMIYNTALYLRLSRDDELQGESGSIQTQRMMLRQYATEHNLNVVDDVLYTYVLSRLQYWSQQAQNDWDKLLKRLLNASYKERNAAKKKQISELKKAEKRKAEIDGLFAKMYEDWSAGRITEYNFNMLSDRYQNEQRELSEKITNLHGTMDADVQTAADAEKWVALIKQYTNPTELTSELLNTLIEKIIVHEAVKGEDGSREQEVEIFYRFIGKID